MKHVIITYRAQHSFRERMLLWLLGRVIPVHAIFYERRKPWGLTASELARYPENTLGRDLGMFLKHEKLEPIDRVERHDAFHILLGFTTHVTDEAAMQYFLMGNGKRSPFTVGTAMFAGLMLPEHWRHFKSQYQRGKAARSVARWDFKTLLNDPTQDLISFIFKRPMHNSELEGRLLAFEQPDHLKK